MQDQLRGRMGFDGVVVTDCGSIDFMTSTHHWAHNNGTPYTPVEATAAALRAGTDLNCGGSYGSHLPTAFQQGLVTSAQIDTAVGRALMGHLELGLFEDTATASTDPRRQIPMTQVDSAPHRELAKEAAVAGVVLLKNVNNTLPLGGVGMSTSTQPNKRSSMTSSVPLRVAVVGPNANRTLTLTSNYAGCKVSQRSCGR
jgi:beta-glucosidase